MADNGLKEALKLFHESRYFECHEHLEEYWRKEQGPRKVFLQGLIQVAAGFHKMKTNGKETEGSRELIDKGLEKAQALKKIADFLPDLPRPAVMCTLVKVTGSAPQEPGARIWVSGDRFTGTLGGGEFERQVLAEARKRLADAKPFLKEYVLCKEMGQCCGGRAEVFFEPVPRRRQAHLFGAGHVGRAAAHVLSQMPFDAILIDSRAEWAARGTLPEEVALRHADPMAYAQSRRWSSDDAVCIFTHSHDLDFKLSSYFLKQPIGYLGLIGSEHKAQVFRTRLKNTALWDEKMHCPIGAAIASKNPKVIAVSIAAELLKEWAA